MTNEELDRLWFEAMHQSIKANENFVRYRFAALVAAAEREACAIVCEEIPLPKEAAALTHLPTIERCAAAIRARNTQEQPR